MIKAVIFDMDGLMFDTERLWEDAFLAVGYDMGYDLNKEFHQKTIGTNYNTMEQIFKNTFGEYFPFDNFYKKVKEYIDNSINKNGINIKKGLKELLTYLKENNYKIAIASSSKRERINKCLYETNIDKNLFDVIISGEDIINGKPNPEIYLMTCKKLNVSPSETIVLEDSNNGIKGAKRANCQSVLIPDLCSIEKEVLEITDYKLESLLDVIELLQIKKEK